MSGVPTYRASRLPAPSSGLKPPSVNGKRTLQPSASKGDLGHPAKRAKPALGNLNKVTKHQPY